MEAPEDLGLVVKTKEEKFWSDIIDTTERDIENHEKVLKFSKKVLEMAKKELKKAE